MTDEEKRLLFLALATVLGAVTATPLLSNKDASKITDIAHLIKDQADFYREENPKSQELSN